MKFKISVKDLQVIFSKLSAIAKIGSDELEGLVFVVVEDIIKFTVSDKNTCLVVNCRTADITDVGSFLCKFKDIKNFISKFSVFEDGIGTEFFDFSDDGGALLIKAKTMFIDSKPSYKRFTIPLIKTDTYPIINFIDDPKIILNSSILRQGIMNVIGCVSVSDVRAAMRGVGVFIKGDVITFAATNGVKLSECVFEVATVGINEASYVFKYTLAHTIRQAFDSDGQVFITVVGNNIHLKCNDVYVVGALVINDSFPDYKTIIDSYTDCLDIPKMGFSDSINSLIDTLDDGDNNRLTISFEDNKFLFKTDSASSEYGIDVMGVNSFSMDVNGRHFNDLLNMINSDSIGLYFKADDKPLVIRSEDKKHTLLLAHLRGR